MPGRDLIAELAGAQLKPARVALDRRGRVIETVGACEYYGYSGLARGRDAGDRFPFLEGLPPDEASDLPMFETPSGQRAHVRIAASGERIDLVFIDATEQWRQQQALQQKANELELLAGEQRKLMQRLEAARDALGRSRDQAEHASLMKSQFIAKMSHEFRTPLTSILGRSKRLARSLPRTGEDAASVAAIERGAVHLLNLVENLLDQAQFDAGAVLINARSVAVGDVIAELAELFVPLAEEKGLAFETKTRGVLPPRVDIDDLRLRQILINLVGNACKYTQRGSVSLETHWSGDTLDLCITDTGPGISKTDQGRIFGAFWRGAQQQERGAGLGLAISRQLVESMGGHLELESGRGRGTRVSVKLPAHASERIAAAGRDAAGARVLIAEDDPDVTEMYAMALADAGFDTVAVDSGAGAVAFFETSDADVILMDRNLRDIDGFEATRRLRAGGCAAPVVMLTASNLIADRDRALAAGCDDFVVKSSGVAQLLEVMTALIEPDV